ncbi:uncharacterized protein LOC113367749 [Ctenocephalides felis]|uniref:uncharacterized protein LOC113367749 n=1 Tax=Ctenocephalides felis TaxID=7515 RepID=UPI000E6E35AC|nr:uncharacterized protein LOC113367749 [Ctenocephalides felis]
MLCFVQRYPSNSHFASNEDNLTPNDAGGGGGGVKQPQPNNIGGSLRLKEIAKEKFLRKSKSANGFASSNNLSIPQNQTQSQSLQQSSGGTQNGGPIRSAPSTPLCTPSTIDSGVPIITMSSRSSSGTNTTAGGRLSQNLAQSNSIGGVSASVSRSPSHSSSRSNDR